MAASPKPVVAKGSSLGAIKKYLCQCLDYSKSRSQFRDRLDSIDYNYFMYTGAVTAKDLPGIDQFGKRECGNVYAKNSVVNPIVISQVDSVVGYLAEVFLSGYPLFPVVSTPENRALAESLEGMIQDHLVLSESIPELQLILKDAGKYNLYAAEVEWKPVKTYEPYLDVMDLSDGSTKTRVDVKHVNSARRINLRNFHWDDRVDIAKLDIDGDYAGDTRQITRVKLKDLLNYLSNEGLLTSNEAVAAAMKSSVDISDWNNDPIVGDYTAAANRVGGTNWDAFGGWAPDTPVGNAKLAPSNSQGMYLLHTFYIRIIPSDFGLTVPNRNSVQVFKVRMINRDTIISLESYTGSMGRLGMFMGQCIEDGFELQTKGYADLATPIQNASTRLFDARFKTANRALGDRALYNSDMIRASDLNNNSETAKIAVRANGLQENAMDNAYKSIPFSWQGTEGLIQDAMLISSWASDLTGLNKAQQGQFTKGNRTMAEFNSINSASENRQRLPALVLEYRFFQKVKDQFKLNILQFGEDTIITSPRSKMPLNVSIEELQKANLQFELADGYTPKSKMANTEALMGLINLIGTSPILQQSMGSQLPGMLAQLATLSGVRGFDEFAAAALKEWQSSFQMQQAIMQMQQQLMAMLQQQGGGQPALTAPTEGQPQ